jgi:hypothetical protein
LTAVFFPTGAALFAAAASVSKARCEVDAQAASTAATRGLVKKDDKDGESDPNKMVWELLVTTARTSRNFLKARLQTFGNLVRSGTFLQKLRRKASRFVTTHLLGGSSSSSGSSSVDNGIKEKQKPPMYAGQGI